MKKNNKRKEILETTDLSCSCGERMVNFRGLPLCPTCSKDLLEQSEAGLLTKIMEFEPTKIVDAINKLGVESLCGVSEIEPEEVQDFLEMMEEHELGEILSVLDGTPVDEGSTGYQTKAKCSDCGWEGNLGQVSRDRDNYAMCPVCKSHEIKVTSGPNESKVNEEQVDVTKMPIIGKVKTIPIPKESFTPPLKEDLPGEEYDVVDVGEMHGEKIYITNKWYKEYKKVPQVIPEQMVDSYTPLKDKQEESKVKESMDPTFGDEVEVITAIDGVDAGTTGYVSSVSSKDVTVAVGDPWSPRDDDFSFSIAKDKVKVIRAAKDMSFYKEDTYESKVNEVVPGETTGGTPSVTCDDCGEKLPLKVLKSKAGYYYGYVCPNCGPYGRESGYFKTEEEAQAAMEDLEGLREKITKVDEMAFDQWLSSEKKMTTEDYQKLTPAERSKYFEEYQEGAPRIPVTADRIGWFRTSQSPLGYNLFPLTDQEKQEFPEATHRVTSSKRADNDPLRWTSIVKIVGEKVYFLDNDAYEAGDIKWQRPLKITMRTDESKVNEESLDQYNDMMMAIGKELGIEPEIGGGGALVFIFELQDGSTLTFGHANGPLGYDVMQADGRNIDGPAGEMDEETTDPKAQADYIKSVLNQFNIVESKVNESDKYARITWKEGQDILDKMTQEEFDALSDEEYEDLDNPIPLWIKDLSDEELNSKFQGLVKALNAPEPERDFFTPNPGQEQSDYEYRNDAQNDVLAMQREMKKRGMLKNGYPKKESKVKEGRDYTPVSREEVESALTSAGKKDFHSASSELYLRMAQKSPKQLLKHMTDFEKIEGNGGFQGYMLKNRKGDWVEVEIDRKAAESKVNEKLSEKGIEKVKGWIEKAGARATAKKLIDIVLDKMAGLSSSDLADTTIFMNGLDTMEDLLNDGDYQGAFQESMQVAREMLQDEGFPFESKIREYTGKDVTGKQLRKSNPALYKKLIELKTLNDTLEDTLAQHEKVMNNITKKLGLDKRIDKTASSLKKEVKEELAKAKVQVVRLNDAIAEISGAKKQASAPELIKKVVDKVTPKVKELLETTAKELESEVLKFQMKNEGVADTIKGLWGKVKKWWSGFTSKLKGYNSAVDEFVKAAKVSESKVNEIKLEVGKTYKSSKGDGVLQFTIKAIDGNVVTVDDTRGNTEELDRETLENARNLVVVESKVNEAPNFVGEDDPPIDPATGAPEGAPEPNSDDKGSPEPPEDEDAEEEEDVDVEDLNGLEKQFFGKKDTDMLYIEKTEADSDGKTDVVVEDALGQVIWSADEAGLDITNMEMRDILTKALEEVQMEQVSYDIVMRYDLLHQEDAAEEEMAEEEGNIEDSEEVADNQPTVGPEDLTAESRIRESNKEFNINEGWGKAQVLKTMKDGKDKYVIKHYWRDHAVNHKIELLKNGKVIKSEESDSYADIKDEYINYVKDLIMKKAGIDESKVIETSNPFSDEEKESLKKILKKNMVDVQDPKERDLLNKYLGIVLTAGEERAVDLLNASEKKGHKKNCAVCRAPFTVDPDAKTADDRTLCPDCRKTFAEYTKKQNELEEQIQSLEVQQSMANIAGDYRESEKIGEKIQKIRSLMEEESDTLKVLARSIVDKSEADRIALSKKGKVVTDTNDPKKWMVVTTED